MLNTSPNLMAMEQYFQESIMENNFNEKDVNSLKNWNSVSSPIEESENNSSSGFECNICLDAVKDPVVTLCGHLFCWPCIYKWIDFQSSSTENQQSHCPVCKTEVSERTIIPLYGRGQSTEASDEKPKNLGLTVPRRPIPSWSNDHTQRHHESYPHRSQIYRINPLLSFGNVARGEIVHPVVGMFGEMVYARIFGNSETLYTYPNSYHSAGTYSPRLRRHLMQADQSLGRVCFFLFCCMVLCLLLF